MSQGRVKFVLLFEKPSRYLIRKYGREGAEQINIAKAVAKALKKGFRKLKYEVTQAPDRLCAKCRKPSVQRKCYRCYKATYREKDPVRAAYLTKKHNAKRDGKPFTLTLEQYRRKA